MAVLEAVVHQKARNAVRALSRYARVRAAYLFGSQVDGKADRWSDIDVAVFIDGADEWDLERRVCIRADVRRQVGDDVELHLFPARFEDNPPRGSFAQYVLKHGVRLDLNGVEPAA